MAGKVNKDEEKGIYENVDDELLKYIQGYFLNPRRYTRLIDFVKGRLLNSEEWLFHYLPLQVKPHPCLAEYTVEEIGSSSEQLAVTESSEAGYNEELDFTLVLKSLKASHDSNICKKKNMAEMIYSKEFPGHVYLKIHDSKTAGKWNGLCNIVSNEQGDVNEFFVSPEAITDEFYLMMCYRNGVENWSRYIKHAKAIFENENSVDGLNSDEIRDFVLESDLLASDTNFYHMTAQEGPAVKTTLFLYDTNMVSLQFDCALAVPCLEWPSIAEKWTDRSRDSGWPAIPLVNDIASKGCLLVPKCPSQSRTNLEWRISFCLAERRLMRHLTDEQKGCYILLKGIWRKFLKPPSGKALQSYHLKNVLLWECENVKEELWTLESTAARIMGLLLRLKDYIESCHCPHYIVPENNLFQDIDSDVLRRSGERVGSCITEAKVVWIQNTALFSLPSEKTRLGMRKEMIDIYMTLVDEICKCFVDTGKKPKFVDLSVLEKVSENTVLQEVVGSVEIKFITDVLKNAMSPNEASLIRRYICTRAQPKQLQLAAADGILELTACSISGLTALSELTEIVTELEVLKTHNFEEYGFASSYTLEEVLRLVVKYLAEWSLNNGTSELDNDNIDLLNTMKCMLPSEDDEDIDDIIIDVIECDGCNKDVTLEDYYHCEICPDFDLCKSCYESNDEHNHDFSVMNEES